MAKRPTGLKKYFKSKHSHKTKKRLEVKRAMLAARKKPKQKRKHRK